MEEILPVLEPMQELDIVYILCPSRSVQDALRYIGHQFPVAKELSHLKRVGARQSTATHKALLVTTSSRVTSEELQSLQNHSQGC